MYERFLSLVFWDELYLNVGEYQQLNSYELPQDYVYIGPHILSYEQILPRGQLLLWSAKTCSSLPLTFSSLGSLHFLIIRFSSPSSMTTFFLPTFEIKSSPTPNFPPQHRHQLCYPRLLFLPLLPLSRPNAYPNRARAHAVLLPLSPAITTTPSVSTPSALSSLQHLPILPPSIPTTPTHPTTPSRYGAPTNPRNRTTKTSPASLDTAHPAVTNPDAKEIGK